MCELSSRLSFAVYFILFVAVLILIPTALSPWFLSAYRDNFLAHGSPIKGDEVIVFFPTYGALTAKGDRWKVQIHSWVFEPEHGSVLRSKLLKVLSRSLELPAESEENQYFRSRAQHFLVDNEQGKEISIQFGNENFKLQRSEPNGHFHSVLDVTAANFTLGHDRTATFQAVLPAGDSRTFSGVVHLLDEKGLSVISDIDDTIKASDVRNKKELLKNTFLREYQVVSGMAERFQAWNAEGAAIHYVSASPWQLYLPLSEFVTNSGFPTGTWAMKPFRWKDQSFFNLFSSPEEYKLKVIEPLMQAFPERHFVLVGDSGEKDPEIYLKLATLYPKQIRMIFIRDLDRQGMKDPRFQQLLQEMPDPTIFRLFQDASELPHRISLGK